MKDQSHLKTRRVRRCARPVNTTNGNNRVVLCLHGFTGYPGEMAYPASRLAEAGWDVRVPRLSGHGTDGRDFMGTGPDIWRRQVADEWMNLTACYDTVFVLGHSMGGLLALDLARYYPVKKVAVMAPAIGIRYKGQRLIRPISFFIKKHRYPWESDPRYVFFDERDDDDDEYLGGEYWSWGWMKQISKLQGLMYSTERTLNRITAPVLGVFGGKDSVVGQCGEARLRKGLGGSFESLNLPDCGHYIPYDPEPGMKESAMDVILTWFEA